MTTPPHSRILVPYDGLARSTPMVQFAARYASALGAHLDILHIVTRATFRAVLEETGVATEEAAKEHCVRRTRGFLENHEALQGRDVAFEMHVEFSDRVGDGISAFCGQHGNDLIITRKSASTSVSMESVDSTIKELPGVECLFFRAQLPEDLNAVTVLVPLDNRLSNLECARRGVSLAATLGCRLVFFFASRELPSADREQCPGDVASKLKRAEVWAEDAGISSLIAISKAPFVDGILEYATVHSVDMILMRSFKEFTFGKTFSSTADFTENEGGREGTFFGDAAASVESQCHQNLLFCKPPEDEMD